MNKQKSNQMAECIVEKVCFPSLRFRWASTELKSCSETHPAQNGDRVCTDTESILRIQLSPLHLKLSPGSNAPRASGDLHKKKLKLKHSFVQHT